MPNTTKEDVPKIEGLVAQFAVGWLERGLEHNPQGRSAYVTEFLTTLQAELMKGVEGMPAVAILEQGTPVAEDLVSKDRVKAIINSVFE